MKSFKQIREKTLTPAEKKKREEIAKAMEKDNPDMPMDKKMAIATATAKRVAESVTESVVTDYKELKAKGKKDSAIIDIMMSMPKYRRMSKDQLAKKIGDAKRKGVFKEEVEQVDEAKAPQLGKKGMVRAKDGKNYKVQMIQSGSKIEFKVTDEFGDFKTITVGQLARMYK